MLCGAAAAALGIVLWSMSPAGTLTALTSLELLGYPTTDVLRPIAGTETLRATATSVDPNIFGGLLMVTAAILVAQAPVR